MNPPPLDKRWNTGTLELGVRVISFDELCKLLDQTPVLQDDRIPEERNDFIGEDISSCQQALACRVPSFSNTMLLVLYVELLHAWELGHNSPWCCR